MTNIEGLRLVDDLLGRAIQPDDASGRGAGEFASAEQGPSGGEYVVDSISYGSSPDEFTPWEGAESTKAAERRAAAAATVARLLNDDAKSLMKRLRGESD